jgi:hypothetical protein
MRPEHHRIVATAQDVGNLCHQSVCSLIRPSDARTTVRVRVTGLSGLQATVDMQPYAHSRLRVHVVAVYMSHTAAPTPIPLLRLLVIF